MSEKPQKNVILALETSGRAGSAAIGEENHIISEIFFSGHMQHNAELLPTVNKLLDKSGNKSVSVREVYVASGPGSFTGIRIAITVAKMMALASEVKIVAVPTMDTIAENARLADNFHQIKHMATIIDAKRNHFFIALFEKKHDSWQKTVPETLMKASEFVERFAGGEETLWLLGEGLVYYKDKFAAKGIDLLPEELWAARASGVYKAGRQMARQGLYTDAEELTPIYLRKSDAEENLARMKQ